MRPRCLDGAVPLAKQPSRALSSINGKRHAAVLDFESSVVDFFGASADLIGVPRSLAAIYGVIFASPAPLSFAEIEARVNLSKGSVSQGLRTLREIGAIKEVSSKADKAKLFEPDLEMRKLIARYLDNRFEAQMKGGRERLDRLKDNLRRLPAADRRTLALRLDRLESWHTRSRRLLPVIRTFLQIT
jgi:DNA-binding transcriptional regulator GbsR (MarR family)